MMSKLGWCSATVAIAAVALLVLRVADAARRPADERRDRPDRRQ